MTQHKIKIEELTDSDKLMMKYHFTAEFAEDIVDIEFVKVNGTERKMKATTNPSIIATLIGPRDLEDGKKERKQNDAVCKVFDVEAKEWRSFRWDSLIVYPDKLK